MNLNCPKISAMGAFEIGPHLFPSVNQFKCSCKYTDEFPFDLPFLAVHRRRTDLLDYFMPVSSSVERLKTSLFRLPIVLS